MLAGQFESKLGKKFQVSFPKRFRSELGDRLVLTKGLENCLIVVSQNNWQTLLEGTKGLPFINKESRELQRFLLGNAFELAIDTKGRVLIPEFLREYANLKEDIVFVGIDRFVEIWSKENWTKEQKNLSQNIELIAEKLTNNPAQEGLKKINE